MPTMLLRHHAMYYQDIGSGFPILFGHSYLWDRRMWQAQIETLSKHYRCIVPDLWSHGFSEEVPQRPYSIELLSKDYYYFMSSLGIKEFSIVGASVGGMWGAQLALNYPKAVRSLVLMDTFVGEESEETKRNYLGMLNQIEQTQGFNQSLINAVVGLFFSKTTCVSNASLIQNFSNHLMQIPHERLAGCLELGYTIFNRKSMLDELKHLEIPVLVACGEEDLPRPERESLLMVDQIPNAEFARVPLAGHMPAIEQPQFTTDLLGKFLARTIYKEKVTSAWAS